MTMIVTAHLGDCILIATDKRAMTCNLETGEMNFATDQEQKIKLWCRGAIAGTGESVFLDRVAQHFINCHESSENLNQMDAINDELEKRILEGVPRELLEHNTIIFSMFNGIETLLYSIPILPFFEIFQKNGLNIIRPRMYKNEKDDVGVTCFNVPPDMKYLHNFQHSLKPLESFSNDQDFVLYYIEQLKPVFGGHAQIDSSITASFDLYIQSCRTGKNIALHVPNLNFILPEPEKMNYWNR